MTERLLGLGFEDVIEPVPSGRFDEVAADAIGITAGRVDWTAFPWPGHDDAWSPWVVETGRDYVAEAIAAAGGRRVSILVDVMAERWIQREPAIAGVDALGERSLEFASVSSLDGAVGDAIVGLVAEVAARYRPHAVALTELFLDRWTFGDDDLARYLAFTGASDWPRRWSGAIDDEHPSIGAWRSDAVTRLVRRCADAARARAAQLHVEVRAQWDGPTTADGQDYAALLGEADRLVVWGYFALAGRDPAALEALARDAPAGSTVSVGLWGGVTPTTLRRALEAAGRGGAASVEVVPMSLMTDELWRTLRVAWNPPR